MLEHMLRKTMLKAGGLTADQNMESEGGGRKLTFSESPSPRPPAPAAPVAAVAAISASAKISAAEVRLVIPAAAVSSSPSRRVAVKLAAVVSWWGLVIATPAWIGPRSCALLSPTSAAVAVAGMGVAVLSLPSGGGSHLSRWRHGFD
jgi:hypothetical protein